MHSLWLLVVVGGCCRVVLVVETTNGKAKDTSYELEVLTYGLVLCQGVGMRSERHHTPQQQLTCKSSGSTVVGRMGCA